MTTVGPPDTDAQDPPPTKGMVAGVRTSVQELGASIASVFRNPGLRRVELALAGSMIGDWAFATAVAVWAYGVGGVTAVGVWTAIRLTLMAFTAPFASTLVDRFPRKRVMVVADLLRLLLVTTAGLCLVLDTPAAPIFVLATLGGLLGTPFRCAQRALMPALASTPEELTASNGTGSTIESLSFFVGPMLGALLITATSVEVVFFLNALTFAWSMVLVLGIHVPHRDEAERPVDVDADDEPQEEGFVAEISGGFRAIAADRDLAVVIWLVSAQTIVAGASAVFLLVMAVDVLGTGPEGVGYLDSILGVGAILGGFLAISRASKHRLAQDLTWGVVLWAAPLLLVAVWASPVTVVAAVVLLGFANPLVDVNLDTIVQRLAPDEVMGRVFGALETCVIATMALGAALIPVLMNAYGLRTSLAIVGTVVTALSLPFLPRMRRLDSRLTPPAGLDLLTAIPMFVPLAPATVEGLARRLERLTVPASAVVVTEGEESDRFFVIESGLVDVTHEGAALRQEGPGDFFGEIGLLRDVPRTATVTAVEDTVLLVLAREDFLAAVTGQGDAFRAADDVVSYRLSV
jgi:MFS family permease